MSGSQGTLGIDSKMKQERDFKLLSACVIHRLGRWVSPSNPSGL